MPILFVHNKHNPNKSFEVTKPMGYYSYKGQQVIVLFLDNNPNEEKPWIINVRAFYFSSGVEILLTKDEFDLLEGPIKLTMWPSGVSL